MCRSEVAIHFSSSSPGAGRWEAEGSGRGLGTSSAFPADNESEAAANADISSNLDATPAGSAEPTAAAAPPSSVAATPPARQLSPLQLEAVADLDRTLSLLGKSSLDADDFARMLQSFGYRGDDGAELFDELLERCRSAAATMDRQCETCAEEDHLNGAALRALYLHDESYRTCSDRGDTGAALTGTIAELFRRHAPPPQAARDDEDEDDDAVGLLSSMNDSSHMIGTADTSCTSGSRTEDSRRAAFRMLKQLSEGNVHDEQKLKNASHRRGGLSTSSRSSIKSSLRGGMEVELEAAPVPTDEETRRAVDAMVRKASDEGRASRKASMNTTSSAVSGAQTKEAEFAEQLDSDCDDDVELTLEDVASSLLRYDRSDVRERFVKPTVLGLSDVVYDPAHFTASQFSDALEEAIMGHDAVNHHLLDSLSRGYYGDVRTVQVVAHFLRAYKRFTTNFIPLLERCVTLVGTVDSSYTDILEENLEEEHGIYDEETLGEITAAGLDAAALDRIPHGELYDVCAENLSRAAGAEEERLPSDVAERIARPLVEAFEAACDSDSSCAGDDATSAATSIAALYFGSEYLVSTLYAKISSHLHKCPDLLSKQDLAFFVLHIDMDVEHAAKMREIVVKLAGTEGARRAMAACVERILDGRVAFYDGLVEAVFPPTPMAGMERGPLATSGGSEEIQYASAHPTVLDACRPHLSGARALDLSCGEGSLTRRFVEAGAASVVGMDEDDNAIEGALVRRSSSSKETYVTADPRRLVEMLCERPAELGVVPGAALGGGFGGGVFDVVAAADLFGRTNITAMKAIIAQVHQSMKPGGTFVFAVPHPSNFPLPDGKGEGEGTSSAAPTLSLRDRQFIEEGSGGTRDPMAAVRFKSESDCTDAVSRAGFELVGVREASGSVLSDHHFQYDQTSDDESKVNASPSDAPTPLYFIFEARKSSPVAERLSLPRKIHLSDYDRAILQNGSGLGLQLPRDAAEELDALVFELVDRRIDADSYDMSEGDAARLPRLKAFASDLRHRLLRTTGAAHVQGLNLTRYIKRAIEANNPDVFYECAKLAFFVVCRLVGTVDGSARGKLFDVVDARLDAATADNVLFSVSRDAAPWHTDGASAEKRYDVASLLCISQAAEGGEFRVSDAAGACERLRSRLPKFLLYELLRAVPRDVLENGRGRGVGSDGDGEIIRFSRGAELLKLRVRHNAYPIFVEGGGDRLQFRYMRHWIETGHAKADLALPPLLKIAMDALDDALDAGRTFERILEPGEMVFCNNLLVAHARNAFVDGEGPSVHRRHMVRAWIQVQEVDRELWKMDASSSP